MKLTLRLFMVVLFAAGCLVHAAAQTSKPVGPPCSLHRQAGDWGFLATGKRAGVDNMATGTYHLNNDGTSSSHLFSNSGSAFLEFDRVGNTTITEDCIVTQTWDDGGPAAKCVVVDDGNEMWCIYEQPAFTQVTLKRIHTRN